MIHSPTLKIQVVNGHTQNFPKVQRGGGASAGCRLVKRKPPQNSADARGADDNI
jgi:hypothetical protein